MVVRAWHAQWRGLLRGQSLAGDAVEMLWHDRTLVTKQASSIEAVTATPSTHYERGRRGQ